MAELSTLARPYARAAFEYADREQAVDAWFAELRLIAAVVEQPAVRALLSDPALTTDTQAQRFIDLCADELGESRRRRGR